jgi:hypothetical protein
MNADSTLLIGGLIAILYGLVACFFGWRIFRLTLTVAGVLIGGVLGYSAGEGNLVIAIVGAIIGGLLLYALFRIGIFVAGALLGAVLGIALGLLIGLEQSGLMLLAVIIGVVAGGLIALVLQKLVVLASTAFGGAASLVGGLALVFPTLGLITTSEEGFTQTTFGFIVWLVLGALGLLFQFRDSGRMKRIKMD